MWVVQEIVCAKEAIVQWGNDCIDWDVFFAAMLYEWSRNLVANLPESSASLAYWMSMRAYSEKFTSLTEVLQNFQLRRATDPRDKVYSLLGLGFLGLVPAMTDVVRLLDLKPDYRVPVQNVFVAIATDCMKLEGNLDVLSTPRPAVSEMPGLPS
jgi:hypothetical protein